MLVQTPMQALAALQQADDDIVAFQKKVDVPSNSANTVIEMYAITNNILGEINSELANLQGTDPLQALPVQDITAIQKIQQDIIDARSVVGNVITAADWSLGGIFDTTVAGLENFTSEIAAPFHINWTLAVIGVAAVFIFFIWVKVA